MNKKVIKYFANQSKSTLINKRGTKSHVLMTSRRFNQAKYKKNKNKNKNKSNKYSLSPYLIRVYL